MKLDAIIAVWGKELLETVRDRRALFTMLVLPTVLIPLLVMGAGLVASKVIGKAREEVSSVLVIGGEQAPAAVAALRANPKFAVSVATPDWRRRIEDKQARVVVEFPEGFETRLLAGGNSEVVLYHYEGELRSGFTLGEVRRILQDYREKLVGGRLADRGIDTAFIKPFEIGARNVAPPEKVGGNAIGGVIPYMFILFCFTGALYPAMDLTAGEKERGTLETVLCSPVGRLELVLGKFLTVLTAALVTVVCSVASMSGSMFGASRLFVGQVAAGAAHAAQSAPLFAIDPRGVVVMVLLSLPMAAFFSALLLALSLNARSIKEAQSTTSPLIVLIILPAMMGMLPGVELSWKLACVPILNLALASKELLSGVWHWGYIALIFTSTCLYAAAALAFCVRQFNREAVLFRS